MVNKIIGVSLVVTLLASTTGAHVAAAQDAQIPPYDPPIEAHLTVKWGNVQGTPLETNKVSFDGSLSVSEGRVALSEVLRFENHDNLKDRITSKANPVSWTSWIFGKWDGVSVVIHADPSATVTVKTDAGSMSIPYVKLLTAPRPTILNFGDGREIVIDVTKIVTDPFYLYAVWGGPVYSAADEAAAVAKIEEAAARLKTAATASDVSAVLDARPALPRPRADFSGALAFGDGAHGRLVETILFEPRHGDKIVEQQENYVEWNSFIFDHFDGIFLKAQLDQVFPIDDTVTMKFPEIGWSKEFSLATVYVTGAVTERVVVGNDTYLVGLVATKGPLCHLRVHTAEPSVCDPRPVPVPVPVPIPAPEPIPVPVPVPTAEPVATTQVKKVARTSLTVETQFKADVE